MQDNNRHLEILQALAAGTAPLTGEVFPANSPYNQPEIIRALFLAINQLEALAEKGKQSLAWSEEKSELLAQHFNEGAKITQLAKLHSRNYVAIKARLFNLNSCRNKQQCQVKLILTRMIDLIQGDITTIELDAIVNAANSSSLGGGGVDGAIHRAGGKSILEECQKIRNRQGGCNIGEAVITTAGKLPAKFVIHTVGPVWNNGSKNEERLLYNAYKNSLSLADENMIQTIAFPNISTGIYHFPKRKAAKIAINTVKNFLTSSKYINKVLFVCFDKENYDIYKLFLNESPNSRLLK